MFAGRGRGDHLGSRDLDDVVALVDGRAELPAEVAAADADVRRFIAEGLGQLLDEPRFVDAIFAFMRPDASSQDRADAVVLPTLRALARAPAAD